MIFFYFSFACWCAVLRWLSGLDPYQGLSTVILIVIDDGIEQWKSCKITICHVPQGMSSNFIRQSVLHNFLFHPLEAVITWKRNLHYCLTCRHRMFLTNYIYTYKVFWCSVNCLFCILQQTTGEGILLGTWSPNQGPNKGRDHRLRWWGPG